MDSFISIESKQSKECIDRLVKIGLAEPITRNEFGVPSDFKSNHNYFHPKRHIPPTNPNDTYNISPVEGYTFSILKSMQNVQSLTHTNGLNRYVCKYVGKIDEQNQVLVRSHPHHEGTLISNATFLKNTKVTSTSINENRVLSKKRDKFHPKGRLISLMEQIQTMLGFHQVRTDMHFEIISTLPLEHRAGKESNSNISRSTTKDNIIVDDNGDGVGTSFVCNNIRKDKDLDIWRQLTNSELITL